MKIAFLCGSCEPGADGVGDYTLSLAMALSDLGHTCLLFALNDRHLDGQSFVSPVVWHSPSLCLQRLPSSLSWSSKAHILSKVLRDFLPDLISLQYVPYSFDSRGWPFSLIPCLWHVRRLAPWHVMFHELWVDPDASRKNRFVAFVQQQILRWLLKVLSPAAVHTSNHYYTHLLAPFCGNISVLPLFSSIPVVPHQLSRDSDSCEWTFIFFGSIHPEWQPEILLEALECASHASGIKTLSFISIGNAGAYGRRLWQKLGSSTPPWIRFIQLGSLPASDISHQLQNADWGVTTTPSHLLGKSGSVAAMLAHDLPVIVPRLEKTHGPWHQFFSADPYFVPLDYHFCERLMTSCRSCGSRSARRNPISRLETVSQQFLNSLNSVL
jgi:glycosyltransferase involved in cell wall biosynthesis